MDALAQPAPEALRVQQWRFECAREVGLTKLEARLFAESDGSLAVLRRLAELGCRPQDIARIVI